MNWIPLSSEEQLASITKQSYQIPHVIFKHSTRCSVSSVALSRLEKAAAPAGIPFYYLDLLSYRSLSNRIAEQFQVYHESPQVLIIHNGDCIYDESHMGIRMDDIAEQITMVHS
jgi:bacillithiol system protein YtxJ